LKRTRMLLKLAALDLGAWLASKRLACLLAAGAAGVLIGPLFISFTFGSDEVIYADVVMSSVWLLSIGAALLLASSSAAEDAESGRTALLKTNGASAGVIAAAKIVSAGAGAFVLWTATTSAALAATGNGHVRTWGTAGVAVLILAATLPMPHKYRVPVAAAAALAAAAGNAGFLFYASPLPAPAAVISILPVSAAMGAAGAAAGLSFRMPVAVAGSLGCWVLLFIFHGYAWGAGGGSGILAGLPVMELPPDAWAALSAGETAGVLCGFIFSSGCIMGLSWVWGALAVDKRDV